jgi:hypothetical protein
MEALDVFDVAAGRHLAHLRLPRQRSPVYFATDGSLYAAAGYVVFWSPSQSGWRALPASAPYPFVLSPDGSRTATLLSSGHEARLVEVRTGRRLSEHRLPGPACTEVGFAPDGRVFVLLRRPSPRGPATLFEVVSGRDTDIRGPWPRTMTGATMTFSPDGRAVAAAVAGAELRVWPLPGPDGRRTFPGTFEAKDTSVADFLPDGRLLRFNWRSGALNLWPAELFR